MGRRAGQEDAHDVDVPEGGAAEVTIGGPRPAPIVPPPLAATAAPAVTTAPASTFTPATPRDESSSGSVALVVVGALLVGAGVALDNLPSSSQNTTFEVLDLAPIALYGAGFVTVCFGVGWF